MLCTFCKTSYVINEINFTHIVLMQNHLLYITMTNLKSTKQESVENNCMKG